MEETEKNYREELRSQRRGESPASRESEPDIMSLILNFAQNNPELLNKVLGNLGGGGVPVPPQENK